MPNSEVESVQTEKCEAISNNQRESPKDKITLLYNQESPADIYRRFYHPKEEV